MTPDRFTALLLFPWVGAGALRRMRGRPSQVKGAVGVAARGRFAPPLTWEPNESYRVGRRRLRPGSRRWVSTHRARTPAWSPRRLVVFREILRRAIAEQCADLVRSLFVAAVLVQESCLTPAS